MIETKEGMDVLFAGSRDGTREARKKARHHRSEEMTA
jgi:hypothetical protein